MIPGEILTIDGGIVLNADRAAIALMVANGGDRPIQVGSHYHFFETNPALKFDRAAARVAWPHPLLDEFAARNGTRPIAHCVAMALACAAHGIARGPALAAWLHATAANLVSAGVRLVPLGQTDGQIAIAHLSPRIDAIAVAAMQTSLTDLGTASPRLDICSIRHETQYTRLFRS